MKKWLGIGKEENTPRNSVLSSLAEWHSFLIGVSVGFTTAFVGGKDAAWLFIILSTIAFGGKKVNVGQLEHVSDEPVYALIGAVLMFILTVFVIIPHVTQSGVI